MTTASSSGVALDTHAQPDDDVIRQVLDGDTGMFEALVRRYNQRVYRTVRAIVRDEQEAEDIMQQTYVNAFTHLRQFNGAARFSTWLTRIAINESLARVIEQRASTPRLGPFRSTRRTVTCRIRRSKRRRAKDRRRVAYSRSASTVSGLPPRITIQSAVPSQASRDSTPS